MKFYNKNNGMITSFAPWGPVAGTDSIEEAQQYLDIYFPEWKSVSDSFVEAFEDTKNRKINEINLACKQAIISGIYSNALENRHRYDSNIEDQLNCIQAYVVSKFSGAPVPYRIWDTNDTTKGWYLHTAEQFEQVMKDGSISMGDALYRCSVYKAAILAATTIEEIDAIMNSVVWS